MQMSRKFILQTMVKEIAFIGAGESKLHHAWCKLVHEKFLLCNLAFMSSFPCYYQVRSTPEIFYTSDVDMPQILKTLFC